MNYSSSKSARIVFSKSILDVKNQSNFFKKKLSKNNNLGDHSLVFFLNSIFEPLSKITTNNLQTDIPRRNFFEFFPWWYVDSWPKTLLFRARHL